MDPRDANSFAYEGLEETKEEEREILDSGALDNAPYRSTAHVAPTTTIDTRNNRNDVDRDNRDFRDRDNRDNRDNRDLRDRDSRDNWDNNRDNLRDRDNRDNWDNNRDNRDNRDLRDRDNDNRDNRDLRDRDNRDNRDNRDFRDRDNRDNRDTTRDRDTWRTNSQGDVALTGSHDVIPPQQAYFDSNTQRDFDNAVRENGRAHVGLDYRQAAMQMHEPEVAIGRDAVAAQDAYHNPSEHPSEKSEGFFSSWFGGHKDESKDNKEKELIAAKNDPDQSYTTNIMDRVRNTLQGESAEVKDRAKVLGGGTGGKGNESASTQA